jgi:glutathione S-transferase
MSITASRKSSNETVLPTLYVFTISHYCEKARWALDYCGIAHRVQHVMPGRHRQIAKQLGASGGSVPFLQAGEEVIAGSSAIIDWAEAHRKVTGTGLSGSDPELVRSIERRLDEVAGVHVRRFFYSDALTENPKSVRPIFSNGLPFWQKISVILAWPKIVAFMKRAMDLGPAQREESRAIVDAELVWLDSLLADGRPFLTGDQFTRADITAAALLAPVVDPTQHPVHGLVPFPGNVSDAKSAWANRPSVRLVKSAYENKRNGCATL